MGIEPVMMGEVVLDPNSEVVSNYIAEELSARASFQENQVKKFHSSISDGSAGGRFKELNNSYLSDVKNKGRAVQLVFFVNIFTFCTSEGSKPFG